MGLYGGSAPSPDPRIGEAAVKSAKLGEDYLAFMREQADVTNGWANEDRARYERVFQPLQDQYIRRAQQWDSPKRKARLSARAVADVSQQLDLADEQNRRAMAARGVAPNSGAYADTAAKTGVAGALAKVGAATTARRSVEAQGQAMRDNAINLGQGFAVNPATSMGLSNGAASSGFSGAMSGQGQMGSMLNQDYRNRMAGYQADQSSIGAMAGAAGTLAGFALMSSKDVKTDKMPARGALKALDDMPVETWRYKKGYGDDGAGRHIGPYAQDFQRQTGSGDGKTIPVVDAIGVTMAAVKELSAKVDRLAPRGAVRPEGMSA